MSIVRNVVFGWLAVGQLACSSEHDESAKTTRQQAACEACAGSYQTCASPQATESISVEVTELGDAGCTLEIQPPSSGAFEIRCEPLQICDGTGCQPAELTSSALSWGTVTCYR